MTVGIDLQTLSFEIPEMLEARRPWIETESPTYDAAAVNRMMDLATRDLAIAGAVVAIQAVRRASTASTTVVPTPAGTPNAR